MGSRHFAQGLKGFKHSRKGVIELKKIKYKKEVELIWCKMLKKNVIKEKRKDKENVPIFAHPHIYDLMSS